MVNNTENNYGLVHELPETSYQIERQLRIKNAVNRIAKYKITSEHLVEVFGSWQTYEYLIRVSNKSNLKNFKKKILKVAKLLKDIKSEIQDTDLIMFKLFGVNYGALYTDTNLIENLYNLANMFNRKKGYPFNKDRILKQAYFEQLFMAETFGIAPPTQNYEKNNFKIYLNSLVNYLDIKEKTLEHYYQEYAKAKKEPAIANKINTLIQTCIEFHTDINIWRNLIAIYRKQIAPLLLQD